VAGDAIATAPGDLPTPDIAARTAALRRQFRHDNTIAPAAPAPGQPVEVWATSGTELEVARATVFFTTDGSLPDAAPQCVTMSQAGADWEPETGFLLRWRAVIPPQPADTRVRYRIGGWATGSGGDESSPDLWAHDGQGYHFRSPGEWITFAYTVEPTRRPMPDWVEQGVIYQIFLDRFHPGTADGRFRPGAGPNERHGGTLEGVRRSLPYLAELGVTCLWLSPLHPAETYHRYDGMDYFAIDPDLGTERDFRALTREAHERGMRVILDFVPSHCSWHHARFLEAQRDPEAESRSWFTFTHWPNEYRSFLGAVPSLPTFNTEDAGARSYLIGAARHWLTEMGVDGFRLDHAIGPGMDFWTEFRGAVEAVKPDVVTIGEATDTPDALRRYRGHLRGILDFPLARALRLTFATGAWGVAELDAFLRAYALYMADGPGRVSFLDNHDMERFLYLSRGDTRRLKLAALCQLTLAPAPVVYYGTEIGLSHAHSFSEVGLGGDAEARGDMPWDQDRWDRDLLDFYRRLIAFRRATPVLWTGRRQTTHLDAQAETYAYLRARGDGSRPEAGDVLVIFNLGPRAVSVPLPSSAGSWEVELSTGEDPAVGGDVLRLEAYAGAALKVRT
jgi:glycosidase